MDLFTGRVALVTGAASGIGRAAAVLFAKHGARVAVSDVDRAGLEQTAELIRSAGGEAVCTAGDVADPATVQALIDQAIASFGRLDCAFNNAGITHPKDHEWDFEAFQRTLAINVSGVMQCIKQEVPHMLKVGKGAIVNTASINAIITSGNPSLPGYTASKHAVVGLTKTAALTWARQGIRVNALLPGVTRTAMVEQVMQLGPEVKNLLENLSPMGRMGTAEEMAEAAIWLCCDKSSFVNGHALVADGGFVVQ
ncbi:MAG TPA: glucose 1-dehydrogenase [Steroidobacteraceae bacterium]|nr:glucose 1-dehydrogenase [Steroidobacteraceae bacterium]